jgi:hypothetical protein
MTKLIHAWHKNLLRNLQQGYPLEVAAHLCNIGMDKIIYERKIDNEFDNQIEKLVNSGLSSPKF